MIDNWKNPITVASGTFNFRDARKYFDLNKLGAITTKGVALESWRGNETPRIAETHGGILNAIGLENPGVDYFIKNDLKELKSFEPPLIVNLAGRSIEDYVKLAEIFDETEVDMLEVNISCPNVKEGGIAFGQDPRVAAQVTSEVKKKTKKPIIIKLSPNVTDITEIARAVEDAGADAISMINTFLGMKIDVGNRCFNLKNRTGGLSGPAIKPIAVRMVWQVRECVKLPIIAMGGVMTGEDAAEFLMAGANAVAVGSANLINPQAPVRILEELYEFMEKYGYESVEDIRKVRDLLK